MDLGGWEDKLVVSAPRLSTAPVLAVLVCHNGGQWLPDVLDALGELTVGPRHLLAVDTGSTDETAELLARAGSGDDALLDGVLTLPPETGFGAAVAEALDHAKERWGDPGRWLWLVHDDSAPEADCLENLLGIAELDSSAAMLGPLGLDWNDPRWVVDAGLSTDATGHRQTGIDPSELDPALGVDGGSAALLVSEVLAVSTACALVDREIFERLSGVDRAMPLAGEDIDLGWRINADGHLVLCVPEARMRHASALRAGERAPDAVTARGTRTFGTAERVHGVRTFLANTSGWSFLLGVPRLVVLTLLRLIGFVLLRRGAEASAELEVLKAFLTGRMGLLAARSARKAASPRRHGVRGLLTSRLTRLRNGLRGVFIGVVRERVRREIVLGQQAAGAVTGVSAAAAPRPVGPDALPAGALTEGRRRSVAGLRRPSGPVVVPVEAPLEEEPAEARPSPVPRGAPAPERQLLLVPVDRWRVARELLFAPAVVLTTMLVLFALVAHGLVAESGRFGAELHGGRLLPVGGLGQTWSDYLASWHAANGGTGAPAPASLLVLALAGTVLAPFGGPPVAVALFVLFAVPLAGLSAYLATRALPVSRRWRALAAGAYALLPAVASSTGQGRLDVIVAHVLVPVLLAGIAAVVGLSRLARVLPRQRNWFGTACLTALGLAVLGAFAPTLHVALVVLAVLGFVLVPSAPGNGRRRAAGLAVIVLLPVACLLPWPVVLLGNPEILLHGLGGRMVETSAGAWVLALSPDGSLVSAVGGLYALAAVLVLVLARGRAVVPGLVVAAVGWVTALLVTAVRAEPVGGGPSMPGWSGAALVLVAAGLMWAVLSARRWRLPGRLKGVSWQAGPSHPKWTASLAVLLMLGLAVSAAVAGRDGPLSAERGTTTPALAADLAESGSLLVVEPGPFPARLAAGEGPVFGDDDLVPAGTAVDWLRQVEADLLSGDRERVRTALASAAARGTGFVAVPEDTAARMRSLAGDLLADHGQLADGHRALRILLPSSEVELLGPDLTRKARAGEVPSPQARPLEVAAELPRFAVRVSEGGSGRALVLAAENEPGWQATIDGRTAPLASAWGNQVAVPLPEHASEVRVSYTEAPRTALLVLQAAAILFTLIGALPDRRVRRDGTA